MEIPAPEPKPEPLQEEEEDLRRPRTAGVVGIGRRRGRRGLAGAGEPLQPCPNPVQCLVPPCQVHQCASDERCVDSYCGGCFALCLPQSGAAPGTEA